MLYKISRIQIGYNAGVKYVFFYFLAAFGPAFDEIVVQSSLTVRRKSPNSRQSRKNSDRPVDTSR